VRQPLSAPRRLSVVQAQEPDTADDVDDAPQAKAA